MHKLKPEYLLANTVSKMSGDRYLPQHCTTSFNLNGAEKFIVNFLKAWQLLVGGTTFLLLAASSSPAFAQTVLFNETFTGSSVSGSYLKGGTSTTACLSASRNSTQTPIPGCTGTTASGQPSYGLPTGGDAVGSGTLRLTSNGGSSASFIINNTPISAGQGREITFDLFSYGGTGADGIGFFLIKGNYSPTTAGATGGSFGYAHKTGIAGLSGGYIGIAFDEFGNFSNGSEGRIGGVGHKADSVSIRGADPRILTPGANGMSLQIIIFQDTCKILLPLQCRMEPLIPILVITLQPTPSINPMCV